MKGMMIPIVTGALGIIPEGLVKRLKDLEIRGQVETIRTIVLLRLARILRGVLEKTCCYSNPSEKLSANAGVRNSQRSKIIIIIYQHENWHFAEMIISLREYYHQCD